MLRRDNRLLSIFLVGLNENIGLKFTQNLYLDASRGLLSVGMGVVRHIAHDKLGIDE